MNLTCSVGIPVLSSFSCRTLNDLLLDEALRSCGLLLRQAMERAETQHQINGMDAHYYTILE